MNFLRKKIKNFSHETRLCDDCLRHARADYIIKAFEYEKEDMTYLEKDVLSSIKKKDTISRNIYGKKKRTFGEHLSDILADFGGSWMFIICFFLFLMVWIVTNTILWFSFGVDIDKPHFILLNLMLSCVAAMQAPVIMMSQNRQESRDRLRAEHDYKINLKAELEIRFLHEKIDLLLKKHWSRLMQIQQMQVDGTGRDKTDGKEGIENSNEGRVILQLGQVFPLNASNSHLLRAPD